MNPLQDIKSSLVNPEKNKEYHIKEFHDTEVMRKVSQILFGARDGQ